MLSAIVIPPLADGSTGDRGKDEWAELEEIH